MSPETVGKIFFTLMALVVISFLGLLSVVTHPKNREISPDRYDEVMQYPYMVEYIKQHGLMKDGVLTYWEVECIPRPNPSKKALLEMSRSN